MKKVYVSDETTMVLESLSNINTNHVLYDRFYEKEVPYNFHVHVSGNAEVSGSARVYGDAEVSGNARVSGNAEATNSVINLIGLYYNITLTDNHIIIGCKVFDFETAKKLGKRNIKKLGIENEEYQKMIEHKVLLLELIKLKEKELENE